MMDLQIEQLYHYTEDELNQVGLWMYHWWGEKEGYSLEDIKERFQHSLNQNRLPITIVARKSGRIIGLYQFAYDDVETRPDIYPWLCNVYVDEQYRHCGVGDALLKTVVHNMQELNILKLYLYTKHVGLYEKYGWEYIEMIKVCHQDVYLYQLDKEEVL